MEVILKVTPETLKEQAQVIAGCGQRMQQLLQEAESALAGLKGDWQGEASDLHAQQAAADLSACRRTLAALLAHPQDLLTMAGLYEQAEREAQQETEILSGAVLD